MSKHYASATWEGNLARGNGSYKLKTSGFESAYSFTTRFEDDKSASSPEELIGAALSSCFSMALAHGLDQAGYKPGKIETEAEVTLAKAEGGFKVSEILLKARGKVDDISNEKFLEIAEETKSNCPVSRALQGGPRIKLEAILE
jgi:lipoyl-dependent peroxiredoxin